MTAGKTKSYKHQEEEEEEEEEVDLPFRGETRYSASSSSPDNSGGTMHDLRIDPSSKGYCGWFFTCYDNCSERLCCLCKEGSRERGCKFCSCMAIVLLILTLILFAIFRPHRSQELLYTLGHSSWDDYQTLQEAIAGRGIDVCKVPITPRHYPAFESSVALYGRSGIPYFRTILEEGTRIASMDRGCSSPIKSLGDFSWYCLDDSWFYHASAVAYDYNVGLPKEEKIFKPGKSLFLIREPFSSAIDLYFRRYVQRRSNLRFGSIDMDSVFKNHADIMAFTTRELGEWTAYVTSAMGAVSNSTPGVCKVVFYNDLDSDELWRNTTQSVFEFIRDPDYYPTIDQSLHCLDVKDIDSKPEYVAKLPSRESIFTLEDRRTLCPLVEKFYSVPAWGDFCSKLSGP